MLTIDEAQSIVLSAIAPLPAETVDLERALGLVLAAPLIAQIPLPPFDNSAMDGYAVIAADTAGATPDSPVSLRAIADIPAGPAPSRAISSGTAARIMTGAMLPAGADAVVMVERTRAGADGLVEILSPAGAGDNVRLAGEDLAPGQPALLPGQVLGPGELGLAAALGCTELQATRRPRVAILTTGSELIAPGEALKPGAIYNSNRALLSTRLRAAGATLGEQLHVADDEEAVEEALSRCAEADLILTTGGVSVGEYDLVKAALEKVGRMEFWRVAIKPGKPVAFGLVGGRPLFGLPGNPVSALVTFELLAAPALRKLSGRADCLPPTVRATLTEEVTHAPGRREYRQAITRWEDGRYLVAPSPKSGSAMLTSTVGANSLLVVPEASEGLRAGEEATVVYPVGK